MLKVGLTGGIATGKSYVLSLFQELGCEVIDADTLAHAAIEPGQPAFDDILQLFGADVLASDGTIDRTKLGRIVFSDDLLRERLNAIVHPRVFEAQTKWFSQLLERKPDTIAIVDAALIIETGAHRRFDVVIVVHCTPEIQVERLMKRNQLSQEDALARVNAQMPSEEKLKYADYAIDTSDGFDATRSQVEVVYEKLRRSDG